jgi:glycine dehydrogenase
MQGQIIRRSISNTNVNMNIFEKQQNEFSGRHIGPNQQEKEAMLATIGVGSLEELISKTIPDAIR